MQFFRVRNWEKFQHYSKRNPPWIRLHQSIMRSPEYQQLSDTCRSHLIGLFLLASQHDNKIPINQGWLKHELCTKQSIDLKTLAASGWIQYITDDASTDASTENASESASTFAAKSLSETETDNSETDIQKALAQKTLALCGSFRNVKLSEDERVKLAEKFGPEGSQKRIDALSEYVASKGKKYASHYATILSWDRKNGNGVHPPTEPTPEDLKDVELVREIFRKKP